jgi:glycosyltransferase involved in cell wall biosynthesis
VPEVSIVVPTFNSDKFLRFTLQSILEQQGSAFEVLISDQHSEDSTLDVVAEFADPRLRIVSPPPLGAGPQTNWNNVTRAAAGTFVKLVCADDLLLPGALQKQVEALRGNPNCSMVASPRQVIRSDGSILRKRHGMSGLRGVVPGNVALRRLVRTGTNLLGEPAAVMFRSSAIRAVGYWDGKLPYVIDQKTYMKVLSQGDLLALGEPLASFRISDSSWSAKLARQQAAQVKQLHQWARAEFPDIVSNQDVRLGNVRSASRTKARRMAFAVLAK